jgi:hypothetical protein
VSGLLSTKDYGNSIGLAFSAMLYLLISRHRVTAGYLMKKIAVLCLVLVISACRTAPVSSDSAANIKSIGVVSAIGDTLTFTVVGTTVFTNDTTASPIENWGIDDFIVGSITKTLKGGYDVRPVSYDKIPFLNWNGPGPPITGNDFGEFGNIVRSAVGSQNLDAYVVVVNYSARDQIGDTNQSLYGLGLYRRNFLGARKVSVYAAYQVVIVDGHTFEVIGHTPGLLPARGELGLPTDKIAFLRVHSDWWADSLDAMSDKQKQQLEVGLKKLLDQSLNKALGDLKLLK